MGEKDITEKILEDHNDVFADIINGLIFAGEQRILPESLENTAVHSQYKADDEKVHELERDVANFFVQKRKNKDYIPDDPTEIKHIDEVLKLLQVMTGDEHYKEVIRKKKGVRSKGFLHDDEIVIDELDNHIRNKIRGLQNTKVYLHYSKQEHTFNEHIIYLLNDLKQITSVDENTANYSDHQDVSLHFPKYLKETVNMLIKR